MDTIFLIIIMDFGGILTGLLFSEIFGSATHNYRHMYFEYRPYKRYLEIKKRLYKSGSRFYNCHEKVTAKFENPNSRKRFYCSSQQ